MRKLREKKVAVASLTTNLFVRQALDDERVIYFGQLIEAGIILPPIETDEEGNIVDGRQRHAAYDLVGVEETNTVIFHFDSEEEKIGYAYRANVGGSLPPRPKDTEHTVRLLLERRVTQKKIAELLGLPPEIAKVWVGKIKTKQERVQMLKAKDAVLESGLTVAKAAEVYDVEPEKLKAAMGASKKKKAKSPVDLALAKIQARQKSYSHSTGSTLKVLFDALDEGDVSIKGIKQVIDKLNHLNDRNNKTLIDWRRRLALRDQNGE